MPSLIADLLHRLDTERRDEFEERAGTIEFDSRVPRDEAERAELDNARGLAEGLLQAADGRDDDPEALMAAHTMSGMVKLSLGDPAAACAHLGRSVACYDPQRDAALYPIYLMDFGVFVASTWRWRR